jgi:hypothetical protein
MEAHRDLTMPVTVGKVPSGLAVQADEEPVIRPLKYPTKPPPEEVELLYADEHFSFGRGPWTSFYGVWDSQAGGAPLEKYQTYSEAYSGFIEMERTAKQQPRRRD